MAAALGATLKEGVLLGMIVSMSSTAIVVRCLMESHQMETRHGKIMLGILLLQVGAALRCPSEFGKLAEGSATTHGVCRQLPRYATLWFLPARRRIQNNTVQR